MKRLFLKFINSEFISDIEILAMKVNLVIIITLLYGLVSIPVSFFQEIAIGIRIVIPLIFVVSFTITFLGLLSNRTRLAMHMSIITFTIVSTYTIGSIDPILVYLLFYSILALVVFYQDTYAFVGYGLLIVIFSIFYVSLDVGIFQNNAFSQTQNPVWIYPAFLTAFYLFFVIFFALNELTSNAYNTSFVKTKKHIQRYQLFTHKYASELNQDELKRPLYQRSEFEKSVLEISAFISDVMGESSHTTQEVTEFYFFLHTQDIEKLMNKPEVKKITKLYAKQFDKYLLNENKEFWSLYHEFKAADLDLYQDSINLFELNINEIFTAKSRKLIALAMMYTILKHEITQLDRWGRVDRILEHEEITALFTSKEFREYLGFEEVTFYLKNEKLFKQHL